MKFAAAALALALAAPARAATVKLFGFDAQGRALDLPALLARLGRADDKLPRDPDKAAIWAFPIDGQAPPTRVKLAQAGKLLTAAWTGGPAALHLVWPVREDGYSAAIADNGGHGFDDGAAVFLEEELAMTEYRLLKESLQKKSEDGRAPYAPSAKARELVDAAKAAIAEAAKRREAPARAAAFAVALRAVAVARETSLYERGRLRLRERAFAKDARFGLTLDDGLLKRLGDVDWIADSISHSGTNWVRLVFAPNPRDFSYGAAASFNEYDSVVKALKKRRLKILGGVLDTAQWPRTLTPEIYAARVKNLAARYAGEVDAWEVGSELNGDWLGGARAPLASDQVFAVFSAGAAAARAADPKAELVATLYSWEETAPDRAHSLSGWLAAYAPKGFGRDVDLVGLDVFPEDNPAGLGLERAFDSLAAALPETRVFLSAFGYVEEDKLKGYWWLTPDDVDGARKDLILLYTAGSCAMTRSVCGGFWWQTLDQMLPPGRQKAADLFKIHVHALHELGR
jgi:hypothetical protein